MNRKAIKRTGSALKNMLLWLLEYLLKIAAPVAGILTLGARGGFWEKITTGFGALPGSFHELVGRLANARQVSEIINDYNTLTAADFNQKYGGGAINYVMQYLNEGIVYLQRVYQNLSESPVLTLLAAVLVFLIIYLFGRSARFIRQKGQGSVIDRAERRAGKRIFKEGVNGDRPV